MGDSIAHSGKFAEHLSQFAGVIPYFFGKLTEHFKSLGCPMAHSGKFAEHFGKLAAGIPYRLGKFAEHLGKLAGVIL